jgi:type I restriction enzyme, S subunit
MPQNIGENRIVIEGIARITPADAHRLARHQLLPGDIVYSRRGDVERRALVREGETGWLCGTGCLRVRSGIGVVDSTYVSYYLGHPAVRGWVVRHAIGATMPNLNTAILSALPFVRPPTREQRGIAAVLSSLDDKIELNRRMNETLEAMAQALFKSWFVDFDPVRAKAEGRKPAGMDAETAALFPDSFEDSVLGEIPQGWAAAPIADCVEMNGWNLGSRDVLESIDYIEISEVSCGDIETIAHYQRGEEPSRARRRLRHGDTVLSTVRPDRRAYFLALHPPDQLVASTGFAVLTPRTAPWSFVHAAMTQSEVFDYLGRHADGGAYPAVSAELIGAWLVAMPSASGILDAFDKICAALYGRAECNRCEARTLAAIRDALLPKLLSGEIRVQEALEAFNVIR